jgi:hypothetical protein
VLVDLPASADVWDWELVTSPDGSFVVVTYQDGGTPVVALFSADLTIRHVTRLPEPAPSFAHATVDDDGVVHVVSSGVDASGHATPALTRLSADGVVDPEQLVIAGHTYIDGVALGPGSEDGGSNRWLFMSGMSDATGVLGVVVIDLTNGREVAETGLCTDYADGIMQPPVVSLSRRMITVVGDCFSVPTVYELSFDPPLA